MSLEDTVRATVRELADAAPNASELAAVARVRGRRIRRRRRATTLAAAGVALIVALSTPFVLVRPPVEKNTPTPEVRRTVASAASWWAKPFVLPGGAIVTALSRDDVGRDEPAARDVQRGNVVLNRITGRYEALSTSYYTVWGAPRLNRGAVPGDAGLGVIGRTGRIRWTSAGFSQDPAWSPDGTRLLLSTDTGYAVLDAATGRLSRYRLPEVIAQCTDDCLFSWLADGEKVAVARRDLSVPQDEAKADTIKDIALYDVATARFLRAVPVTAGIPVDWSSDARFVLVRPPSMINGDRQLVDTTTGKTVMSFPDPSVHFLPDDQILGLNGKLAHLYDQAGRLREEMVLPDDFADRTISVGRR